MTLREALMAVDLDKVHKLINKKDSRNIAACDRPTMEQTVSSYTHVVKELLSKPKTKPYDMPWLVEKVTDHFDKRKYISVCFLNRKYVAPPKGAKPWGGKNPPKGSYNCNLNKHNRTFACGWTPWSKIIDTPIVIEVEKISLEQVVAEILWEITFYGWTEEKTKVHVDEIKDKIKEAEEDYKKGNYVELPPKKKGGLKIVIPDTVAGQMIDIINKYAKKKK